MFALSLPHKHQSMPAKGSDDLFRLIKALSPAEKGYFKKFADRYSFSEKDNNYLKLFELIEAQETYDEKLLVKEKFINQLPRQKNYLQNLILKSIQMYDSESNVTVELENSIQQVRALIRRGQYDLAAKVLQKAKKEALAEECFPEALKLVKFENYLNKRSGMDKDFETEKLNYAERYSLYEKEKNFDEIQELEQQVIMFKRNPYSKNTLIKNKLLSGNATLLSQKAKTTYYNTLSHYYGFIRQYEKQYLYAKEHLQLKKTDYNSFTGVSVFMSSYINFFFACYNNRRYKECNDVITELMRIVEKNEKEHERRERNFLIMKTQLFIGTGKLEQGLAFITDKLNMKSGNEELVTTRMDTEIKRNLVLICFANKKYKECLKLVDALLSPETKDYSNAFYYQALLLNILIHYELGNKETAEHLIVSARRTFKSNNRYRPLEEIMLTVLKKQLASESAPNFAEAIQQLSKANDEDDLHFSIHSFCLAWLESKLNGTSLPETIRIKAKKDAGKYYWN